MAFVTQSKLRSSHCGPDGRLHLARHFEIINRSVEDWFAGPLGLSFTHMHSGEQRLGIPTVRIGLTVQQAAALGEVLQISLQVVEVRRSSIELEIVALCDESSRFNARVTLIMAHAVDGRLQSMAIPAALKQTMLEYVASRPDSDGPPAPGFSPFAPEDPRAVPLQRFHQDRPVFFQDCDPAQIVFYPRYLEMIDDLVDDWLRSIGVNEQRVEMVDVEFRRPSQLGDLLRFSLEFTGVWDTRIQLLVSAECEGESRLGALLELSVPNERPASLIDLLGAPL